MCFSARLRMCAFVCECLSVSGSVLWYVCQYRCVCLCVCQCIFATFVTLFEQGQCTKETLTLFRARRGAMYQVLANCYFPPVVPGGQVRTINTTKLNKTQ